MSIDRVDRPQRDLDSFRPLSGAERDAAFMELEREIRRLTALQIAMVGEVSTSLSYLDDCHRQPRSWLQAVANCAPGTAVRSWQTALMLADLPALEAVVAIGDLGSDQLELLRQLWANERCRAHLPASIELLIGAAQQLTFRDFRLVWQRWRAHADPDGAHHDHEVSRQHRRATSSASDAGHVLHVEGDALSGEILDEILDAHAEAEYQTDLLERSERFGDLADHEPLARTSQQRRYDAMVTIFLKAAGTSDVTGQVPLVNIVCDESTARDAVRNYFGYPCPADPPESDRVRICHTTHGAPVDPADLAVALLIGNIRRVVVDSAGRVIDLGRRVRVFTGAAREAVLHLGTRCSHPGCEHRSGIQIDHLRPWARASGPTNPFNGGPTCPAHNRDKHHHHITVTRDHTGWHHHRPDGTEICPRE